MVTVSPSDSHFTPWICDRSNSLPQKPSLFRVAKPSKTDQMFITLCLSSSLLWLLVAIHTNHGHRAWIVKFWVFFFKEKEVVLVWDPYIFLGSPVSLYDCTTMTNNHTESWVSWSPALWLNQNVRKIENVIWVSFHSCIHSVICSFIKCLLNWLNYSERNELCSLPTHSSERSRWQWVWVYGGGWQRHMPKSLWPKKRKTEENTFSRESLGKGQEAVGVINSPQIQERSHECDGI